MEKKKKNMKIIAAASKIAKALEDETEAILQDAEEVVQKHIPARYVKAALKKIEEELDENGIEASFDKSVSRDALKKTASVNYSAKELHEALDKIAEATIAEFEDMLADGDEVATRAVKRFASAEQPEVESKLKSMIEKRMHKLGVYCKFSRVTYDPKKSLMKNIKAMAASKKRTAGQKKVRDRVLAAMKQARTKRAKK